MFLTDIFYAYMNLKIGWLNKIKRWITEVEAWNHALAMAITCDNIYNLYIHPIRNEIWDIWLLTYEKLKRNRIIKSHFIQITLEILWRDSITQQKQKPTATASGRRFGCAITFQNGLRTMRKKRKFAMVENSWKNQTAAKGFEIPKIPTVIM